MRLYRFEKAFDTVPHINLLKKINNYGMRGNLNNLIFSYLKDRKQLVDINDKFSDKIVNQNAFWFAARQ